MPAYEKLHTFMEQQPEKKPKRPRVSAQISSASPDSAETNYSRSYTSVDRPAYQRPAAQGYQPRQNYAQGEGGYNRYDRPAYRPTAGYQHAEGDADHKAEGSAAAAEGSADMPQQGGYQPRQGFQPRQGGYQPRQNYGQQGGYQPRQGYQQRNNQGGYGNNNNRQGGYQNRNNNQGGYGNNNNRQGGYNNRNNNQGGYGNNNNRQGGYQNRNNQGGYGNNNNRQGGFNNRNQQGGYQKRNNNQGGYGNNNRQGGFNNRNQQGKKPGMKFTPRPKQIDYVLEDIDLNEPIRLNKYMANAGICSRREADEYITGGLVKVNGETVTELGTKINRTDVVEYDGRVVTPERKCYVLLNKPKDCVTTSEDPNGRLTVLDVVKNACQERIYPVGRLDRNTTGVLLLTNDGELASKLTHPKYIKKKIYHVWTDKDISEEDMQRIADGIELEDGEIHADAISYVNDTDRNQAGIEIHSGRNRIVRRIFESLGYRVTKLDRVYFAGLTKKNLPRGRWRYLTQEEVNFLRMGSFE